MDVHDACIDYENLNVRVHPYFMYIQFVQVWVYLCVEAGC